MNSVFDNDKIRGYWYSKQLAEVVKQNALHEHFIRNSIPLTRRRKIVNRIKRTVKSFRMWLGEKIAGERFN